jgi:hypothetical protein
VNPRAEKFAEEIKLTSLIGPARALADEAVLVVDRLEDLDKVITGRADSWLGIMQRAAGTEIAEITINVPLAEARQQQMTLRALLSELAKVQGQAEPVKAPVSKSDELAARRSERRTGAM